MNAKKKAKKRQTHTDQIKKQIQKPKLKLVLIPMKVFIYVKMEVDSIILIKITSLNKIEKKIRILVGINSEKYYFSRNI